MVALHLIIHKELLELQNINLHYDSVLQRIKEIENSEKEVKCIPWYEYVNNLDQSIFLSEDYEKVVLYGYSRKHCLKIISNMLISKGIFVSYDIKGTA